MGRTSPPFVQKTALEHPGQRIEVWFQNEAQIGQQAGADVHVILVLDRAGWHVAKALELPANMTLLYLPPYSPELNPVERLGAYLRSHCLSNRVYKDDDDLLTASGQAWNQLSPELLCSICHVEWIPRMNKS